jgi:hypothetical protein
MPQKLTTTVNKITTVPNSVNASIIDEFYQYMRSIGASEHHQNNNLKVVIAFAKFLGSDTTFREIQRKEQIIRFLDTKVKSSEIDPEKKWITTWNHYLYRIKLFMRWLHNYRNKESHDNEVIQSDWETPAFIKIRGKKSKHQSPYIESEIWDRDELLAIVKYEPYVRNKAALTL